MNLVTLDVGIVFFIIILISGLKFIPKFPKILCRYMPVILACVLSIIYAVFFGDGGWKETGQMVITKISIWSASSYTMYALIYEYLEKFFKDKIIKK